MTQCWCGSKNFLPFGSDYQKCLECETLISASISEIPSPSVADDERDFYGREYWFSHQENDLGFANITSRSRTDLPERCLHWLRVLFKYKLPPGRVLDLGSAHGGFVALLRWAGFEATGLELSPWVVEFAKETFRVPMLLGPVEKQQIERGTLDVIALLDVLEHLPDPTDTMRHCLSLLRPDGILVIQTPCLPEGKTYEDLIAHENRFKEMLQKKEHIYLFSRSSIHEFFHRLGADHLGFEPAIFSQYDMFFVVSRVACSQNSKDQIEKVLSLTPSGRLVQALMDLKEENNSLVKRYGECIERQRNEIEAMQNRLKVILKLLIRRITAKFRGVFAKLLRKYDK